MRDEIAKRCATLRAKINAAAERANRAPESVTLLAASKSHSSDAIRAAFEAGICDFGENYCQEALEKIAALSALPITWHFIGSIQSNKTQAIAGAFQWVHGVNRVKIAERLSLQRPEHLPSLNVCIEVNLSREASKSGVLPEDVLALAQAIVQLPRLRLRGLMSLPAPSTEYETQLAGFVQLAALQKSLTAHGFELDTLSMGMSQDFEAAIAAGSTLVRIGTALFGPRTG